MDGLLFVLKGNRRLRASFIRWHSLQRGRQGHVLIFLVDSHFYIRGSGSIDNFIILITQFNFPTRYYYLRAMASWQNFKVRYAKGLVINLVVSCTATPGLIFFDRTESIQGSLHVSEYNDF